MSYTTYTEQPNLRRPVLILAFAGWNDASEVATTAVKFLVSRWEAKKFAELDPEDFYNFARVRPHVRLEEDHAQLPPRLLLQEPELDQAAGGDGAAVAHGPSLPGCFAGARPPPAGGHPPR